MRKVVNCVYYILMAALIGTIIAMFTIGIQSDLIVLGF